MTAAENKRLAQRMKERCREGKNPARSALMETVFKRLCDLGGGSCEGRHYAKDKVVCRNKALMSGCELGVGKTEAFVFLWK